LDNHTLRRLPHRTSASSPKKNFKKPFAFFSSNVKTFPAEIFFSAGCRFFEKSAWALLFLTAKFSDP